MFDTFGAQCIRISLFILGIWPEEHKLERKFGFLRHRFLIPVSFLTFLMFIPQSANLFIVYNNLVLTLDNLTLLNFPIFIALVKIFVMKYNAKVLGELVRSSECDWKRCEDAEDKEIMRRDADIVGSISIGCFIITQVAASLKNLQMFFMIMQSERDGLERIFGVQSLFPPICKVTPLYELVCLGQIISVYFLGTCYISVDCFIFTLLFHICAQFKILHRTLKKTINSPKTLQSPNGFKDFLRIVVTKHEYLNRLGHNYRVYIYKMLKTAAGYLSVIMRIQGKKEELMFAKSLEESFNLCFLVQILVSTLLMCLQYFSIFRAFVESEDIPVNEVIFLVLYIFGNMLFIYFYCYMGELLVVASNGLTNVVLESNWYKLTPSNMKMLMFIIHRSRKPLKLTAGKFSVLSMTTYSNVLKTAAGYLSVMMSIEGKREETT
ncbi:odorant receptor 13a-like [Prorops nasuta]|uniref:odorant receptor 13a-like n=1 Tax=Prorops nasuta TaxID=863751 RepID=UPI0034CED76C